MIEFTLSIQGSMEMNGVVYEGTKPWLMLLDKKTGEVNFKKGDGKGRLYFILNKDQISPFVKTLV